ncbi:MAG: nucleotidyltransferase domain-containing protein [Candidatus Bathyarchaeota archaeon]|nr:nucleotidyltransferase domain-containing protein [Candidatus Bathyarchaeota archaeon]
MTKKVEMRQDTIKVFYTFDRWSKLQAYREKTAKIMTVLEKFNLQTVVHGSIARGDVTKSSDIDIFVVDPPSSFQIETALEVASIKVANRFVVQATPLYAMKAYIELDEKTTISFPLMRMRKVEREFYKFSGEVTLAQLKQNLRVKGVDKRLMLIKPTKTGHEEISIIGNENQTAKILDISVETVLDRTHALRRRDAVGRTGTFIKRELQPNENFEMILKELSDANPAVRRRIKSSA